MGKVSIPAKWHVQKRHEKSINALGDRITRIAWYSVDPEGFAREHRVKRLAVAHCKRMGESFPEVITIK